MEKKPVSSNEELKQLGTHASAATDLFRGRKTANPKTIDKPAVPNPGPYDTRTGYYE